MEIKGYALFLAGTSQVGKTEFFEKFPYHLQHNEVNYAVTKQKMAARDIRIQLGNPTWKDLSSNLDLMIHHQSSILDVYMERCNMAIEAIVTSTTPSAFLFERSLFDNVGYTYAFLHKIGWNSACEALVKQHTFRVQAMQDKFVKTHIRLVNLFEPIKHHFAYDELNGVRPPSDIRLLCEKYLDGEGCEPMWTREVFDFERWANNQDRVDREVYARQGH